MKNWQKVLKFTLKQALKGKKYLPSTIIVGIVIIIAAAVSSMAIAGTFDKESRIKDIKAVYIVNETDLAVDTEGFVNKHKEDYPYLGITEVTGISAEEAASDPKALGKDEDYSIVLDIAEDDENCHLTVYIPGESSVGNGDAKDFAKDFSETVKNAKFLKAGVSEEKLNMAVNDLRITTVTTDESDEDSDSGIIEYIVPMIVMMSLYFLIIFYGQSIGQIVSMEKTSKLMEYILTLSGPSGIIFGKVTAIFCEAMIQLVVWIACGFCGITIGNVINGKIVGQDSKNLIAAFVEKLPEGASENFVILLILAVIALLVAFLFYCFVSALFASFAATAEELTQTNSMAILTMVAGFLVSVYVPLFTDNSKTGLTIISIIPFTSAFTLPGNVLCAKISPVEYILYLSILLVSTVLLAVLTGRVYKNRLFKRGTKGMFAEIVAVVSGKAFVKTDADEAPGSDAKGNDHLVKSYDKYDKAKKTYTIICFALLTFMLGCNAVGGGLVGNVIANLMAARSGISLQAVYENKNFLCITNIVSTYMIGFPLCVLVMKLADESVQTVKGSMTKSQYIRAIFIMFPVTIALSYLSNYIASVLSGGEAENSFVGSMVAGDSILAMIMVSVLAPIFEELIFRKLIIDRARRYGEVVAILFSAAAFGIFHCNLYQLFYAFALGIIFGYVYVRTGNIILTIIMHMIMNSSSSVLYPLATEFYGYFINVMIVLGIVSIIYTIIKKDVIITRTKDDVSFKELSSAAFLNSGTFLFTGVCIFFTIYMLYASTL